MTMSAGKKVRGAATPKSVEVKGPMTNPKASSPKAPAMKNSNKGASASAVSKSESESATNAGFVGTKTDLNIKDEVTSRTPATAAARCVAEPVVIARTTAATATASNGC
jgi:hypothetical protein